MFLTPFPLSEIICILSMFLTSLYLLVGTIGNIQPKTPAADPAQLIIIQSGISDQNHQPASLHVSIINSANQPRLNTKIVSKTDISYLAYLDKYRFKIFSNGYVQPVLEKLSSTHEGISDLFSTRGPPTFILDF